MGIVYTKDRVSVLSLKQGYTCAVALPFWPLISLKTHVSKNQPGAHDVSAQKSILKCKTLIPRESFWPACTKAVPRAQSCDK